MFVDGLCLDVSGCGHYCLQRTKRKEMIEIDGREKKESGRGETTRENEKIGREAKEKR